MSSHSKDIRQQLKDAIEHFEHTLPGQAPINDFVHHNTLHGYQHLHFTDAVAAAKKASGAAGYLPDEQFRAFYQSGRIKQQQLDSILSKTSKLEADKVFYQSATQTLLQRDLYRTALTQPMPSLTACQLTWQMEELDALHRFQQDVPATTRQQLLTAAKTTESVAINDLWQACLNALELEHFLLHPEDLIDLTQEQSEQLILGTNTSSQNEDHIQLLIDKESDYQLKQMVERVGQDMTLRGLLKALTGEDLIQEIRPIMVRRLAAFMDQGTAAWSPPGREKGFYAAWREGASQDPAWLIDSIPEWKDHIDSLPEDALETVIAELRRMDLPENRWADYLQLKALELPGWSGMFLWRHLHPGYEDQDYPVDMMDYLAFRLALERLISQKLCRETWQIEPSLKTLRWYFRHNRAELLVRYTLFNTRLPEYLSSLAQKLVGNHRKSVSRQSWQQLAYMIRVWQESPVASTHSGFSVYRNGWQLFRMAQHLGLCAHDVQQLSKDQLQILFNCIQRLDENTSGYIWLQAYEMGYRDDLFACIAANHGRGRWQSRDDRITAQLVFCMDDREEGLRRHLEELDPTLETLGAAAHFNVPNLWCGLDDKKTIALTPVVIEPAHIIQEQAIGGQESIKAQHDKNRNSRFQIGNILHQEIRRNLFSSAILSALAAPFAFTTLTAKFLAPLKTGRLGEKLIENYEHKLTTEIALCAEDDGHTPTPAKPRLGFTDEEQLQRALAFLQNNGLESGFSPLLIIMAHGSDSQNNPHLAAYNCGACSGRHSGPNARILAAILNRPAIRKALSKQHQITLPESCWVLGAEHNTCTEGIVWYDLPQMPEQFHSKLEKLRQTLDTATKRHAHERCRKFASAPQKPSLTQAQAHIAGRAYDFSQARPELGHATNAAAVIGRRSVTRGAFLDRRVFLISYDPTTDKNGAVLERLLLANGPVGAGINLEYYFSTVDNENYGCSSKVTHNVNGMFGVMEGGSSDLRTGLPKQMIEIHEAVRLQVMVEASIDLITEIYKRQPPLQELIGNGWLLVSAKDPDTGEIHLFEPDQGWVPWQAPAQTINRVANSADWYSGHMDPLAPVLINETEMPANA